MHKKLSEAKLRLVIKTDIKDISSVGQRVTLAQDTKFKCVGYGRNWDGKTNSLKRSNVPLNRIYLMLK